MSSPRTLANATRARGVGRTLAVLQALNINNRSTVKQLQQSCGLSRPAIYRVLEGLIDTGFVSSGRVPHTYVLTAKVRSLGQGYTDDNLIAEIAAQALDALQKKVVWPTELATLRHMRMQLQDTTRHRSPMVIDGEVVGRDISLLSTGLGMAFLAGCSPAQRQPIVEQLRANRSLGEAWPGDRKFRQAIESVDAKGYAWREGGILEGFPYQTSTIAIPIRAGGEARAAIAITFFRAALTVEQAAARYLTELQRTGRIIEKRLNSALAPLKSSPKP